MKIAKLNVTIFLQSLGASPAPVIPSRLLADPIELERRLAEAGHDGFSALCEDPTSPASSPPPTIIEERLHQRVSGHLT